MIAFLESQTEPLGGYTDRSAVAAWLRGHDEAAAAWLVDKYLPLVRHIISRKLHWNTEDAVQETWVRVFVALEAFDSDRCMSTWLGSIASHTALDHIRRKLRCREISAEEVKVPEPLAESPLPTGRAAEASALVEQLAPGDRMIMRLHCVMGCTAAEISRMTGLSRGNVAIRLMRARQSLAEMRDA